MLSSTIFYLTRFLPWCYGGNMTQKAKIPAPRKQLTLTSEEAELITQLKIAIELRLGFSISQTKVVRIALNKLAETELS